MVVYLHPHGFKLTIKEKRMTPRRMAVLLSVALLFAGRAISAGNAQEASGPTKAVHLKGLNGVKDNAKGTLTAENGQLHFVHHKEATDVSATSIEDVVTGVDSQRAVGKTIGTLSMAAPYGSGRFLSLFRTKFDTLTVQYRDSDGALHGVIFTMPVGAADVIKKGLVAQGAHTTAPGDPNAAPVPPANPPSKEQKQ
jgi:hypothetical protein